MNDQYGWHFVVTFFFHVTFDTSVGCAWCDSLGVARKGGRWLSCGYRLGAARGGGGGGHARRRLRDSSGSWYKNVMKNIGIFWGDRSRVSTETKKMWLNFPQNTKKSNCTDCSGPQPDQSEAYWCFQNSLYWCSTMSLVDKWRTYIYII